MPQIRSTFPFDKIIEVTLDFISHFIGQLFCKILFLAGWPIYLEAYLCGNRTYASHEQA